MGGGSSSKWPSEKRPKVPSKLTLLDSLEARAIRKAAGTVDGIGAGGGGMPLGVPDYTESAAINMRKCDCCGESTIPIGSRFVICSVCRWQDDPEQKANPYLKNRSNKMSLQEAQRALAEGEEIN